MKHYIVYFTEASGATSPIDQIVTEDGYTAEQYVADCDKNADPEWCEMLHSGEVTLEPIEE